ncbi:alpha/beta hydrolase [Marinobacter sp. JSM 1782161]|uniref:alpha/beta hydrolase n=1 Tax=Marinobacter sp. JSM 1782161 TaxID=2685906 RepID=UPI001403F381|nr:alpha/beta hydrolase [Marinobacter sp. JSM 1782161]
MLQTVLQSGLRLGMQAFVKPLLTPALPVRIQRRLIRQAYRLSTPPAGIRFTDNVIDQVPYREVTPADCTESALLYLHGGAFLIGSPDTHKGITGHLAATTGARVVVPDYRLAPEHPYPAALDDALTVYRHLLSCGYHPDKLTIAGDSAGGGLALALALRLKREHLPLPGHLVLLSPWLDLTHKNTYEPAVEPVLQLGWIKAAAEAYRGTHALADPLISPLFDDLSDLPPILIQVGSQEILFNDAQRLADKAREAGVSVTLEIYDGLWHVFQIHAGALSVANEAITNIATFIHPNR